MVHVDTSPEEGVDASPLVNEEQQPQQPQSLCERFSVAIIFTIFVLFRALDRVFLKNINNALSRNSYNLIWANVLWPLAIQLMTICMLLGYIGYMRWTGNYQYNAKFFLPGNPAASSMGPVPLLQLALFSLGDQLNAAISSPPSPYVTLPIQSVMTNTVLVWMALAAFFWIGARYKQTHFIGICLVLMSVAVQLSNRLFTNDCSEDGKEHGLCFSSYKDANGNFVYLPMAQMALWYIMFFVSTLPAAIGNVYKQKVLQGRDVDVWYATWWSGNFQVLWGWALLWITWLPLPGQDPLSASDTFSEIGNTLSCLGGNMPREDDHTCVQSPPPWFWVILYLCFNITFNIALLYLTKRMTAVWAQIATVLCTNLCSIFSQYTLFAGDAATWMTPNDWLGLLLASIALWTYNLEAETKVDGGQVTQQAAGSFVADGRADLIEKVAGNSSGGSFVKQSVGK